MGTYDIAAGGGRAAAIIPRPNILVRLKQNQIDLGREQAAEHHGGADAEAHAQAGQLDLVVVVGAKVDGDEGEPHDASARIDRSDYI